MRMTSAGDREPSATISVVEGVFVVITYRDADPGCLFKTRDERIGRLFVLAVVQRDRHVNARARTTSTGGEGETQQPD